MTYYKLKQQRESLIAIGSHQGNGGWALISASAVPYRGDLSSQPRVVFTEHFICGYIYLTIPYRRAGNNPRVAASRLEVD